MKLVEPGELAPRVGLWDHALAEPNLEDARCVHALAPLARVPGARAIEAAYRQRLRLKVWQYTTVAVPDGLFAFAIGTAGFAGNGFCYFIARDGRVTKKFSITPLGAGVHLAPSSAAGQHRFARKGLAIAIDNLAGGRQFDVTIDGRAEGSGEPIRAQLAYRSAPRDEHFSLCVPLWGGRWNYTHKLGAFAVSGTIELGGRKIALDGAFGTVDFSKMYALRHAVWRWIAVCVKAKSGAVVGVNLVDPTPEATISENCIWIDGRREPLAGAHLAIDGTEPTSAWRIVGGVDGGTGTASVELAVRPFGCVEQRLDVPLIRHRLRHVGGLFSGVVRTERGDEHVLEDAIGIAEDNDTWW